MVIAEETSGANLRWAGNTLTTNGVSRSRQLTVIAIDRRAEGTSAGVISRAGVRPDQIVEVVREAEHAAAEATPAEDAEPLAGPETGGPFGINRDEQGWNSPPGQTEIGVLRGFAAALGEALREAQAADRKLYGFAEHDLVSTFLGTSGGLRLRYDQPTGRVELNAKSADLTRSAWAGVATRDFTDVDIAGLDAGLSERLDWAKRSISLPAGRYETLLPPTAVSDLMIYLYWSAGAPRSVSPSAAAKPRSTPISVRPGGESQRGSPFSMPNGPPVPDPASGSASSAGVASAAACSASRTTSSIWSGRTPAREITPAAAPSARWSMAMTVSWRERDTPLVVSVLPAQRRLALEVSSAITTQSSDRLTARARSTASCGENPLAAVTAGPPRPC